jgi:large subunit ribosomal protein L6
MPIPAFVNLEHDTASRQAFVTVQDREVKKQREMWGKKSLKTFITFYL